MAGGKKQETEAEMDPETRLKKMVKETGEVQSVYGGFEITVTKPNLFPWYRVIHELVEIGQNVWMSKKEGRIHIRSEPKEE
jgi:hypothetical protein